MKGAIEAGIPGAFLVDMLPIRMVSLHLFLQLL